MNDQDNPLKNIPPNAFTIIQASHAEFHRDLAFIPIRYPTGRITYINNHQFVPMILFSEEYQDRLDHIEINTLDDLLKFIESDTSSILFIEYKLVWFGVDKTDQMLLFNEVCKNRARKGGPVVVITAIMDRALLVLDGKADFFFQIGKTQFRGRCLAIKEQTHWDELSVKTPGPVERKKMCGQVKLGEW